MLMGTTKTHFVLAASDAQDSIPSCHFYTKGCMCTLGTIPDFVHASFVHILSFPINGMCRKPTRIAEK
jgi:hypothetical protein